MSASGRGAREAWWAALVCVLGAALFLHRPLLALGDGYFSSVDFAQLYSLFQVDDTHRPGNSLLSDPPTQMQPWLAFARDEFAAGRFPFWNPFNGNGAPLFANFQSALLSPFSLPLYLLPWKLGLIASAGLKLAAIAFFTWLYLRSMRLGLAACALGASGFALCGHNVLLLGYPHSGVTFVLPACLYFLEVSAQRVERGPARLAGPLCGLLLALVAGLYAGHPEPYFFCTLLIAVYALARLWHLRRRAGIALGRASRLFGAWAATAACALCLCAPQLLPFREYLEHSRALGERSALQTPLRSDLWPLEFFASVLGNPGDGVVLTHEVPPPNYELANMSWAGPALLLVALAAGLVARRRLARFSLAVVCVWCFYAYDWLGLSRLTAELPLLGIAPINRSQPVPIFALCIAAACGIDALQHAAQDRAQLVRTRIGLAAAGLLTGLAAWSAWRLVRTYASSIEHEPYFETYAALQFALGGAGAAAVLGALAVLVFARDPSLRSKACWTLPLIAFLLPALQWRRYNPVTPDSMHFPRTPALRELLEHVGDDQLAIIGEDTLPPCTNLEYRLRLSSNYDALWVRDHDQLYRELFGGGDNWRPTLRLSENALRLFGMRWVLARWDWLPIDNGMSRAVWSGPRQELVPLELSAGQGWSQTFRAGRPGLSSVAVWLSAPPSALEAKARIVVSSPSEQRQLAELVVDGAVLAARAATIPQAHEPRSAMPGRWVVLRFETQQESGPRAYEVRLQGEGGAAGASIVAWRSPQPIYWKGGLRTPGGEEPGTLVHDFAFHGERFEAVTRVRQYGLYRYANALPRYYVVEHATVAANTLEGLRTLRSPSFDPGACALFVQQGPESVARIDAAALREFDGPVRPEREPARPTAAEVLHEEPCRVELRVHSAGPAVLATSQTFFPGWRATVNGVEQPVLKANLAFQAVELPAGDSTVLLEYEPTAWGLAWRIAAAGAAAFVLLLWFARWV